MDDPLFVWSAAWIQRHPGDCFGFVVNWFGVETPMTQANYNPPTTSYCLALAASLLGWQEIALHGTFLLAAFAAAAGIYHLAKAWCKRPLMATVAAIFTPVFLVCGTTLMCDVLMLAFLVWAMVMWESGLKSGKLLPLLAAGLLAGLAVLTKYSAFSFLALLFILGVLRKRKAGLWLLGLAVPVAMLAVYELITAKMYGQGLFSSASQYASEHRYVFVNGWVQTVMIGLAFTGGCLLPVLFYAPLLWPRRIWITGGLLIFGVSMTAVLVLNKLGPINVATENGIHWCFLIQMALLATGGLHLLLLTALEWWRRHDVTSAVLALWIYGTFLFATVLNWTVSARSLLPMVPAAAILLMRRLDSEYRPPATNFRLLWPVAPAAAAALSVATADFHLANSARSAGQQIVAKYQTSGARLWFQGHWGFQFYMQELGAQPVDFAESVLQAADILVVPSNNSNITRPDPDRAKMLETIRLTPCTWLTTMQIAVGAGFYSADAGPLPFAIGKVPPELYRVFRITKPLRFGSLEATQRPEEKESNKPQAPGTSRTE